MAGEKDRIVAAAYRRGLEALRVIADDLQGEAARRAPVEEGTLRGSGEVEIRELPGRRAEAIVSFSTPYAARQHEETSWAHPRGGQAKYLEGPLLERAGRYRGILAAAIRKAF